MAFPDLFKLEKLKILAYSDVERRKPIDGSPFEAMFNPQTFSQTVETRLASQGSPDSGVQSSYFVRSLPSSLTLNLLLDGTGIEEMGQDSRSSRGKTVQERVDGFLALAYFVRDDTHEPAYLKMQWGKFVFECRLVRMTVNYTSFARDGSPLRAELTLSLAADSDITKQVAKANITSPDVSHARVVSGGDTLPLLTHAVYGSTTPVLRVARANGLDHIRRLTPGQTLIFPPLER
jgi:hypothetical protein